MFLFYQYMPKTVFRFSFMSITVISSKIYAIFTLLQTTVSENILAFYNILLLIIASVLNLTLCLNSWKYVMFTFTDKHIIKFYFIYVLPSFNSVGSVIITAYGVQLMWSKPGTKAFLVVGLAILAASSVARTHKRNADWRDRATLLR